MQTIILKENRSEHFELITYPDGQHSIKLHLEKLDIKKPVVIFCSIRNFAELEVLLCLIAALKKYDFNCWEIHFAYLFGMRSDRAFYHGQPNYFRDVVAPIINTIKHVNESIKKFLFVPHSTASASTLTNCSESTILHESIGHPDFKNSIKIGGDQSFVTSDICFSKIRNGNGIEVEIDKESLEKLNEKIKLNPDYQILICDDLCDGGATFIAESKYLKEIFPKLRRLALFVFHGLFTRGIDHVAEHFDHIYCTNSYQDLAHPKVTCIDIFKEVQK